MTDSTKQNSEQASLPSKPKNLGTRRNFARNKSTLCFRPAGQRLGATLPVANPRLPVLVHKSLQKRTETLHLWSHCTKVEKDCKSTSSGISQGSVRDQSDECEDVWSSGLRATWRDLNDWLGRRPKVRHLTWHNDSIERPARSHFETWRLRPVYSAGRIANEEQNLSELVRTYDFVTLRPAGLVTLHNTFHGITFRKSFIWSLSFDRVYYASHYAFHNAFHAFCSDLSVTLSFCELTYWLPSWSHKSQKSQRHFQHFSTRNENSPGDFCDLKSYAHCRYTAPSVLFCALDRCHFWCPMWLERSKPKDFRTAKLPNASDSGQGQCHGFFESLHSKSKSPDVARNWPGLLKTSLIGRSAAIPKADPRVPHWMAQHCYLMVALKCL